MRQASHALDILSLFRSFSVGAAGGLSTPGIAGSSGRRGALIANTSNDGEGQRRD
jgi:hypothetical protein